MTTVAYRNGMLAADRRIEANGWINPFGVEKVFRLGPACGGGVAAVTGEYHDSMRLVDWFRNPVGERPHLGGSARVIILRAFDQLTIYEGVWSFDIEVEFAAWGSGMPPAVAAMIMGADARRAVEVAAMVDGSTSPSVDVISLVGGAA